MHMPPKYLRNSLQHPWERAMQFVLVFFTLFFLGWVLVKPFGGIGLTWFSDLTLTITGIFGGVAILLMAHYMKRRDRVSWLLIGGGILCWGLGQVFWSYYELLLNQQTPFPSLADVGYLAMIPLFFGGLLALPTGVTSSEGRYKVGLEAFIGIACIATFSWFFVLEPIYSQGDVPLLEKVIGLAYPAGDTLYLCALISGFARGWIAQRNPIVLVMICGILLYTISDLGFTYLTLHNAYSTGGPLDLGWPLGILFIVYAALLQWSHGPLPAQVPSASHVHMRYLALAQQYILSLLVFLVIALLFVSNVGQRAIGQNIFVAFALITVLLVLVRQFITIRDNTRLNQHLHSVSQELADIVQERTMNLESLHSFAAALSCATTIQGVCELGLQTFQSLVRGSSATLFLSDKDVRSTLVASTGTPVPSVLTDIPATNTSVNISYTETAQAEKILWVRIPQSNGAGYIAITNVAASPEIDSQTLETMGVAFGVAYENQQRFAAFQKSEARFRSLVQHSSDIVTIIDVDMTIRYLSPSLTRLLGYLPITLIGANLGESIHPVDIPLAFAMVRATLAHPTNSAPYEWRQRHADGSWRYTETVCTNLLHDPNVQGIVLNTRDVSERFALGEQLTHQAFHDPLTGLANRTLFHTQVEKALKKVGRDTAYLAVLFLDLDNFKTINDSLGHSAGDQLLIAVAGQLLYCLRTSDIAARLGGDEFAILLEDIHTITDAVDVADRIIETLHHPLMLESKEVFVNASIGIAGYEPSVQNADEILRNADVAMYIAKGRGKGHHELFRPQMHETVLNRIELEADLQQAIAQQEFAVHYQPIVNMKTGKISGAEALVRWVHPTRGVIPPVDFITVAEETGVIVAIGRWVLQQACQQAKLWQDRFPTTPPFTINVNLSARQLQDAGLIDDVKDALRQAQIDPKSLVLEITESVVMHDMLQGIERLKELKALGVRLAIDDFGTGYSSLSYLRDFPVDIIKIDKSFVDNVGDERESQAILTTIAALGEALDLRVVAEGIEHVGQYDHLRDMGYDFAQGYLISKPLTYSAMEDLIAHARTDDQDVTMIERYLNTPRTAA